MNTIVGNYNGLDSMYLSDQGNFEKNVPAIVSARNSLSIHVRKDILYHIENMKNRSHLPLWMFDEMIEDANNQFDHNDIERLKAIYCFGTTNISVEDALQLEKATKEKETKEVLNENVLSRGRVIHYIPRWPSVLIYVHPSGNEYGAMPYNIPPFLRILIQELYGC